MNGQVLSLWNEGRSKERITDFVKAVTMKGQSFVPVEERIAVFDNDGTLWCEKPMPIELGFILERLTKMAAKNPSLQAKQPWKSACSKDYAWLGGAVTKHYHGDDEDLKVLIGGILRAFKGMTTEEYEAESGLFLHNGKHPTLGCGLCESSYAPMVQLLRYLGMNGFAVFIASGGDRDFMRTISQEIYGVPPERVIGSSNALRYEAGGDGGHIVYQAQPDIFDDGPAKPVRIWSRIGQRPILAVGNSNGDIPMLEFASGSSRPSLRIVVLHDDKDREFDYTAGAERSLELAQSQRWTVVSIKNDWKSVFAPAAEQSSVPAVA